MWQKTRVSSGDSTSSSRVSTSVLSRWGTSQKTWAIFGATMSLMLMAIFSGSLMCFLAILAIAGAMVAE